MGQVGHSRDYSAAVLARQVPQGHVSFCHVGTGNRRFNHRPGSYADRAGGKYPAGFAQHAQANVHVKVMYGRSTHHKVEAVFKCFARALRYACSTDERLKDELPSTKGLLI